MIRRTARAHEALRERVGQQLRAARLDVKKTQGEVAAETDMNQGHISEAERGLLNITLDTLCTMAGAVGKAVVVELIPLADTYKHPRTRKPKA